MLDVASLIVGTSTTLFSQGLYYALNKFPASTIQKVRIFRVRHDVIQTEIEDAIAFSEKSMEFMPLLELAIQIGDNPVIWKSSEEGRQTHGELLLRCAFECRGLRNPTPSNWMRFFEDDFVEFLRKLRGWVLLPDFNATLYRELKIELNAFTLALSAANRRTEIQRLTIKADFENLGVELESQARLYKTAVAVIEIYFFAVLVYVPVSLGSHLGLSGKVGLDLAIFVVFCVFVGRPLSKDQKRIRGMLAKFSAPSSPTA